MMDAPRRDKLFLLCAGLFICAGLWLAAYGALVPYSYWWDELYSVVAASSSWDFMFSDFILRDVHPPLYQITLKLWICLFSNAEIASRYIAGAYYDDITRTLAQAGIAYGIYLPQQRSARNVYVVQAEESAPGR